MNPQLALFPELAPAEVIEEPAEVLEPHDLKARFARFLIRLFEKDLVGFAMDRLPPFVDHWLKETESYSVKAPEVIARRVTIIALHMHCTSPEIAAFCNCTPYEVDNDIRTLNLEKKYPCLKYHRVHSPSPRVPLSLPTPVQQAAA